MNSADVRLSVGPNLSRAACQRPVDLRQSKAWTGSPSERKSALTSGLRVVRPEPNPAALVSEWNGSLQQSAPPRRGFPCSRFSFVLPSAEMMCHDRARLAQFIGKRAIDHGTGNNHATNA